MSMRGYLDTVGRSRVYKAPEKTVGALRSVFLAGSIDMGAAEDWQERIGRELIEAFPQGLSIFNPRRDDWDSSWVQDISDPQFNEQVTWELDHLAKASLIAVYFDPKGEAPITLMELGLHASSGKMIVCCPEGFWRRGNVQIVCARYGIRLVETLDDLIEETKTALTHILP